MSGGAEIGGKYGILLLTAAVVTAADQVTKAAVMVRFMENQMVEVIPGFFNLVHFKNPGAAFGILGDGGFPKVALLVGLSVAALVVVVVLVRQSHNRLLTFGLSLIAGGAVGNLIDRVRYGMVVDFLDFYYGSYHWPAFNVADSAITTGVAIALVSYYFLQPRAEA